MTANKLTLSRLGILLVGVYLLYQPGVAPRTVAFVLAWVVILVDAVDGPLARRRGEASALGSILDIAIDRVVECVYWIAYTDLQLVPAWVAFVAVTRGILTDAVRGQALTEGQTPFEMMHTRWGRRLVPGAGPPCPRRRRPPQGRAAGIHRPRVHRCRHPRR